MKEKQNYVFKKIALKKDTPNQLYESVLGNINYEKFGILEESMTKFKELLSKVYLGGNKIQYFDVTELNDKERNLFGEQIEEINEAIKKYEKKQKENSLKYIGVAGLLSILSLFETPIKQKLIELSKQIIDIETPTFEILTLVIIIATLTKAATILIDVKQNTLWSNKYLNDIEKQIQEIQNNQ